jgi:hypothetical protein
LFRGHEVAAGEVLVKLFEHARQAPMPADLDIDRDDPVGDGSVRRIHSRSRNVEALLARLSEWADVEYAEPNYILRAHDTIPVGWDAAKLWGIQRISAPAAWDVTKGTAATVVAVVDTGIDYNHPDLAANVWEVPEGIKVSSGGVTCEAGTHGFNAITKTCDPMDDNGHGTHVAGTIGGDGYNGTGVTGVNWTTSIMGLKFLNRQGSGSTSDAVDAIQYAIDAHEYAGVNVRVLSNSWGGGEFSQALLDAILRAQTHEILFVASAGNNGRNTDDTVVYPAGYEADNIVSVAATDAADKLASWSNFGVKTVDLAAPGVDIYSTLRGGKYGTMSGTSMAAPHVSGAAALVLSTDGCGSLPFLRLKNLLLVHVDKVLPGKSLSGGRLNVARAVANCSIDPGEPAAVPDFKISAAPPLLTVKRGATDKYTVTVSPVGNFSGKVDFTVTQVPSTVTAGFNPTSVTYSSSSVSNETYLFVTPGPTTKTEGWTYVLKITARTDSGLLHSITVRLSVTR